MLIIDIFYSLMPKSNIADGTGIRNTDLGMICDKCLPSCSEEVINNKKKI